MKKFCLLFCLTACGTTQIKAPWTEKYIGKEGYLAIKAWVKSKSSVSLNLCNKVKIIGIRGASLSSNVELEVKQGDSLYTVWALRRNNHLFTYNKKSNAIEVLGADLEKETFVKSLSNVRNKRVSVNGKNTTYRALACEGSIVNGMNKSELLLSWGYPSKINKYSNRSSYTEQWIYGKNYVYLDSKGIITSWQSL